MGALGLLKPFKDFKCIMDTYVVTIIGIKTIASMFNFSCFNVKININVASHLKAFVIMLLEYTMETCGMILNEYNDNRIFKIIH
jgi:hypothetical protein